MATRIAPAAAYHPVDRRVVGETSPASRWIEGDIGGLRRVAAAILLSVTGLLFLAPPAVGVLVLTGIIR